MAKTLVALYNTCTDAERVVHELITDSVADTDELAALREAGIAITTT